MNDNGNGNKNDRKRAVCGTCFYFKLNGITADSPRGECYLNPPYPRGLGMTDSPEVSTTTAACRHHESAEAEPGRAPLPGARKVRAIVRDLGIAVRQEAGQPPKGKRAQP